MNKSQKRSLTTTLKALLFIAILGGILFVTVKFAPNNHFADNDLLKDVSDKYRY